MAVSRLLRLALVPLVVAASFLGYAAGVAPPHRVHAAGTITGVVFRDYNENGAMDAREPGVPAITVTATDGTGAVIDQTTSASDGTYSLNVPGGTAARVEFTNLPAGFQPGPHGLNSGTTVQFVTAPASGVDLGIDRPSEYCQDNPKVATPCYVFGDQINGANSMSPVLITYDYNSPGPAPANEGMPGMADQVGTTWGLTYQRATDTLYAGAYMKRHTGFGPGGPGAIYSIANPTGAASVTTLTTLSAGVDPHLTTDYFHDYTTSTGVNTFDAVGKVGLGGMRISEDDQTLFTVNLFDRKLYAIPVSNPAGQKVYTIPGTPNDSTIADIVCQGPTGPSSADARPFGLGEYDGLIYVGVVCSAQDTANSDTASGNGDVTKLQALIYQFDPVAGAFTNTVTPGSPSSPVLHFSLNYPRRCANGAAELNSTNPNPSTHCNTNFSTGAVWRAWTDTFQTAYFGGGTGSHPQPMLSDIAFDNGNMIIGLRDRFGDQTGNNVGSTDLASTSMYRGITAGDVLRACGDPVTGWALENNGTCGTATGLANNGRGVGGGQFYYRTDYPGSHDDVPLGSLEQLPGKPNVLITALNAVYDNTNQTAHWNTAGSRQIANADGSIAGCTLPTTNYNNCSYAINTVQLYDNSNPTRTFGKANGLGGLTALCTAAPLEIGNRIWYDTNGNGIQDAGEPSVGAGVTVRIYDSTGTTLLGTTTTDANGDYYFNNADVTGGLQPNTQYVIKVDTTQPAFAGFVLTQRGAGSDAQVDSDGVQQGTDAVITLTTGGPGANNHTYDFGFTSAPATPTDTNTTTATGTPTSTDTPTATGTGTSTPTDTGTSTNTPTNTSTSTDTATPTDTGTNTSTSTDSPTPTNTGTSTATPTNTGTSTGTATATATATTTPTSTGTVTNTPSNTPTPRAPGTMTPTATSTPLGSASTPTTTPQALPADLGVVKTVNDAAPPVFGTIIYTMVATNHGPADATGVVVHDPLPAGLTYLSSQASAGSYNATTGDWSIGNLSVGSSATLQVSALVTTFLPITNSATIHGNQPDQNPSNNTSTVTISPVQSGPPPPRKLPPPPVPGPPPTDTPVPAPSAPNTPTATVVGGGQPSATPTAVVRVFTVPPATATPVSTSAPPATASPVAPTSPPSATPLPATRTPLAPASDTPTPEGAASSTPTPGQQHTPVPTRTPRPTTHGQAGIPASATPGRGTSTATAAAASPTPRPPGSTTTPPTATPGLTIVPATNIPLAAGTQNASATASPAGAGPSRTVTPTAAATVASRAMPFVRKTSDQRVVAPGQAVRFIISLTNPGTAGATHLMVSDAVPPAFTVQRATASAGMVTLDGQRVTWTLSSLGPGRTALLSIDTVAAATMTGGVFTNTTTLQGLIAHLPITGPGISSSTSVRVTGMPNTGLGPAAPTPDRRPPLLVWRTAALLGGGGIVATRRRVGTD